MKTLVVGSLISVRGTRWPEQSVGATDRDYRGNKEANICEKILPGVRACFLFANALCISSPPQSIEKRVEVEVGEVVRVKGYGTFRVEKPGWLDGDQAQLVPARLCRGCIGYGDFEKRRQAIQGPPQYDNS